MSTLPETTLAYLRHLAAAGQYDAKALLHLLARADKRDQDVAEFVDSYSRTIAALCRRLEALEREANLRQQDEDAEAALADVAEGLPDSPTVEGSEPIEWVEARCAEALAVIRPVMRQHGIRTSEWPAAAPAPAPPPAASADGLLEKVASGLGPATQAAMEGGALPYGIAYAAIREVAAWLDTRGQHGCSVLLREEIIDG
jgi:hypothetical protein